MHQVPLKIDTIVLAEVDASLSLFTIEYIYCTQSMSKKCNCLGKKKRCAKRMHMYAVVAAGHDTGERVGVRAGGAVLNFPRVQGARLPNLSL